jgi:hypothetical protein
MKSARREKQDNMQELFGKKNKKRILFKTGRGKEKQIIEEERRIKYDEDGIQNSKIN